MPPSAPEILEERGDEHEQRREREERLDALLDRDPGDHVDRARRGREPAATRARSGAGSAGAPAGSGRAATRPATAQRPARVGVNQLMPTRYVARNRPGKVTMSPAAVTSGGWTLSRSKSKRTEIAVDARPRRAERRPTTTIPPTTEITTKSAIEIVFATPNATETAFAQHRERRARSTATMRATRRCSGRRACRADATPGTSRRGSPCRGGCRAPRRRCRACRSAAGTSTRRPGSASRVPVIAPSVRPARRSPPDESEERDETAAPTPLGSDRTSATKRRRRRGQSDHLLLGGSLIGIRLVRMWPAHPNG